MVSGDGWSTVFKQAPLMVFPLAELSLNITEYQASTWSEAQGESLPHKGGWWVGSNPLSWPGDPFLFWKLRAWQGHLYGSPPQPHPRWNSFCWQWHFHLAKLNQPRMKIIGILSSGFAFHWLMGIIKWQRQISASKLRKAWSLNIVQHPSFCLLVLWCFY